jgi:hypothetical protein
MKLVWKLAPVVLLALTGCTLLDRESYSLIVRKGAHVYTPEKPAPPPPDPAPEPARAELASDVDASLPDPRTFVRHDLDAVIDRMPKRLDAFRPFAYCHLHRSSHVLESSVAIVLAPVEYPMALGAGWAYIIATGTLEILMAPLRALFPPAELDPTVEERKKPGTR